MFFKQRVCIEFLTKTKVHIVTSFREKKFDINKECYIDLTNFVVKPGCFPWPDIPSSLFAYCYKNNDITYLEVIALVTKTDIDSIEIFSFDKNKKGSFTVATWCIS